MTNISSKGYLNSIEFIIAIYFILRFLNDNTINIPKKIPKNILKIATQYVSNSKINTIKADNVLKSEENSKLLIEIPDKYLQKYINFFNSTTKENPDFMTSTKTYVLIYSYYENLEKEAFGVFEKSKSDSSNLVKIWYIYPNSNFNSSGT